MTQIPSPFVLPGVAVLVIATLLFGPAADARSTLARPLLVRAHDEGEVQYGIVDWQKRRVVQILGAHDRAKSLVLTSIDDGKQTAKIDISTCGSGAAVETDLAENVYVVECGARVRSFDRTSLAPVASATVTLEHAADIEDGVLTTGSDHNYDPRTLRKLPAPAATPSGAISVSEAIPWAPSDRIVVYEDGVVGARIVRTRNGAATIWQTRVKHRPFPDMLIIFNAKTHDIYLTTVNATDAATVAYTLYLDRIDDGGRVTLDREQAPGPEDGGDRGVGIPVIADGRMFLVGSYTIMYADAQGRPTGKTVRRASKQGGFKNWSFSPSGDAIALQNQDDSYEVDPIDPGADHPPLVVTLPAVH